MKINKYETIAINRYEQPCDMYYVYLFIGHFLVGHFIVGHFISPNRWSMDKYTIITTNGQIFIVMETITGMTVAIIRQLLLRKLRIVLLVS